MIEKRKLPDNQPIAAIKSTHLPEDYLKMVNEVFSNNFEEGLKVYEQIKEGPYFHSDGGIFSDEIVLSVSLLHKDQMIGTSVHGSIDFDPTASSPTAEELLGAAVDAIGSVYSELLDPSQGETLRQVAEGSLASLENIPFTWTEMKLNKKTAYLKVDKANPKLERMTDDWLKENDPDFQKRLDEEQKETEELFVTSDSIRDKKTTH